MVKGRICSTIVEVDEEVEGEVMEEENDQDGGDEDDLDEAEGAAVDDEDDALWETMSTLSISTSNCSYNPVPHCEERQFLRGITPIEVQRAKMRGYKEDIGNGRVRYTWNNLVVISSLHADITTYKVAESPFAETKLRCVGVTVAPGEGLGLKVKKVEDKAADADECMVVVGFTHKNTAFEAKGVRPGDVIVAVQSVSVLELPYAAAMAKVAKATKMGGMVTLTFVSLCSYSFKVAKEDGSPPQSSSVALLDLRVVYLYEFWAYFCKTSRNDGEYARALSVFATQAQKFGYSFDRAIRSLLPHRWSLVEGHGGVRLCVEATEREVLRQWQGLVECAKADGFFKVPFHMEGSVRDEKALSEIEEATHTTIYMQVRKDLKLIVVLVLPDRTGTLGNIPQAVRRVKSLQTVPDQQHFVQGRVYVVQGAGRGGSSEKPGQRVTREPSASLLSLHQPRHQPKPKHVFASEKRNDDTGGNGGKKKRKPGRNGGTQTSQKEEKGGKPGKKVR